MGSIIFQKQDNRLNKKLPGEDHISAILIYAALPNLFCFQLTATPSSNGIALVWSPIAGATGYSIAFTDGVTSGAGAASAGATAIPLANLIANTEYKITFNATVAGVEKEYAVIRVTTGGSVVAKAERVKLLVDTPAAEALGITATSADINIKILHYFISEFFRVNPGAQLYVAIYPIPAGAYTFNDIEKVRNSTGGKIRQMGVYNFPFSTANLTLLQNQADDGDDELMPFEILCAPNIYGTATNALTDLKTLTNQKVHVIIGQDGAAIGKSLFVEAGKSISCLGAALGAVSLAKVSENIGWVDKFNMANIELEVPALSNGDLIKDLSAPTIAGVNTKRYIYLKKYISTQTGDIAATGTYFNDSHSACSPSSDFSDIESNRTIDKAIRNIYTKLLPSVNGPVLTEKGTGKLRASFISHLELEAGKALEDMEKAEELSGYTVEIDADQDVASTSKIVVNISNDKVGISRDFVVKIGY